MAYYGHLRAGFLALHILGGQVGLPVIILTYFISKQVKCHPTLVNFWITWVIYSISYCLLIYSKQSDQSMTCRVQSAMIHGAPPMCTVATLIVVIQTWMAFHNPLAQPDQNITVKRSVRQATVILLPYVAFLAFAIPSAIWGNLHLQNLDGRNGLYCTLRFPALSQYAVPIFCTAMLLVIVAIEGALSIRYLLLRRRVAFLFPLADSKVSPSLVLRMILFNLYAIGVVSAGIIFVANTETSSPWPFMVQAAMPLVAFLVFGTQMDLLRVWCWWRQENTEKEAV